MNYPIYINDMKFQRTHTLLCQVICLASFAAISPLAGSAISINQVGYETTGPKLAIVSEGPSEEFRLVCQETGKVAYKGKLSAAETWPVSGGTARVADFSALAEPGTYRLVTGDARSDRIHVADRPFASLTRGAIRYFFYNRASMALDPKQAGVWARPAGHPDEQVYVHASAATEKRPAGTVIKAPRGWYDAGDYNKYIVNSGISTYTLLRLFDLAPDYFRKLNLNIPESGGDLPDLLDEIKWNLDWMLAMQDPNDGAVYHKLSTLDFSGEVVPHEATGDRYVIQKSLTASFDFAAVMAFASRLYKPFDEAYAKKMLAAAETAYQWAMENPGSLVRENTEGVSTGAYADTSARDEKHWAAAELFITTGRAEYASIASRAVDSEATVPAWPEVNTLALYSLALDKGDKGAIRKITEMADSIRRQWAASAYRLPMDESNFHWGSNSGAANTGMLMLIATMLSGNSDYREVAVSCLDYLLGRNPLHTSFVTGYGERHPLHPHHRISEADGIIPPVPGMLVGGPNPDRQDGCEGYRGHEPALSWVDSWCSYASNEVAINWNSPLAFVAGLLDAMSLDAQRKLNTQAD